MNTIPTYASYSTELNSFYDAPNYTGSPERRLLLAILERAILDFVGNDPREIQGSSDWLFSDDDSESEGEFSFNWVCSQLDLDPGTIAEYIRAMPKRGSHRIAPWYLTKNYGSSHNTDGYRKTSLKRQNTDEEISFRKAS